MPLLTLAAIARKLGVHEQTARKITANWPYIQVGSRRKFERQVLESYLRRECRTHSVHIADARHTL
jgi:hypothetical protein